MRATLSTFVAAAALAAAFNACNSSESGPPVPIQDFPRLLADAVCNNIGPCCQTAGFAHDPVQCHTTAESQMRAELERMRSINEVYDAVAARGCVDAYTAVVKGCRDGREIGSACRFIFAGTLMPGQTCMSTSECTPGASCQRPRDGGTSQCTNSTPAHGQPGESCSATCTFIESSATTTCSGGGQGGSGGGGSSGPANCFTNDGLYCDAMHLCAMMPALNQPCTVGTPCAGDAFCDNGVCAAKRTAGSCGQNNDGCAAAAYCDAARQCQLRKSTGAACTTTNECATTDTCSNGTCRARTIATARSCMGNL